MTDTRQLLADYATRGSEAAFGELVARYVNLVYSPALRLVGDDAHLSQDVTQIVFSDLARQARGLSSGVLLGGWLHQRTFHVATTLRRSERRRWTKRSSNCRTTIARPFSCGSSNSVNSARWAKHSASPKTPPACG